MLSNLEINFEESRHSRNARKRLETEKCAFLGTSRGGQVSQIFFHKKHVFVKHPNAYTEFTLTSGLKNSESGEGDA